jgi:hypothetical protein
LEEIGPGTSPTGTNIPIERDTEGVYHRFSVSYKSIPKMRENFTKYAFPS